MKAISIKDIARKAGVSISTASYALNGVPKVRADTKERILKIAAELNYQPNSFAKSLKTRKTRTIGLFVSHMDSPYYFEILQGIDESLRESGYDFVIARIHGDGGGTGYSLVRERRIDAVILLGGAYVSREYLGEIAKAGLPACVTDRRLEPEFGDNPNFQYVDVDNEGGMRLILDHLWDHGYRRLAFMCGTGQSYDSSVREKAFLAYAAEKGVSCPPEWMLRGEFREDAAFSAVEGLIRSGYPLPEAVCCANDQMAIGVIGALRGAGLAVPEDMAVTGFDNLRQSAFGAPGLTTIDRKDLETGRMLAENLVAALDEGRALERTIKVGVRLEIRGSCGKHGS